jgi:regulator of CtrA degradation
MRFRPAARHGMGVGMTSVFPRGAMAARLIDSLYIEAMVLADEARTYFDTHELTEREALSPDLRLAFACESLKVTTRLMHVVAWLLTRRAEMNGELTGLESAAAERRLGFAASSDADAAILFPKGARDAIAASSDLYARVARLDGELAAPEPESPARSLLGRLAGARF